MIANGGSEDDAKAYLNKFFDHVRAPGQRRDATTAFRQAGDVLLSYENEAILARQTVRTSTTSSPTPRCDREPGGRHQGRESRQGLLDFMLSTDGRRLRQEGFRPVDDQQVGEVKGANDPAKPFPAPPKLFTIDGLNGWEAVNAKYFDEDGLVPELQKATGRSQ